ncbi:bacteriophage abortive infection AbiH family protein [Pedobacter sp. MC2016-14]|uniref:AbiH family protein n=1 Tax=Pedobacter sp. MC2016-14 TaxID=2897327 RepID=UPI001E3D67B3|nr:AbiH family protein [Pedobacter sp. MC2016-14]MCD0489671.1 bacteriophage abortive infection AbiH family protein [Pedobacter sp. MC2016-14]
MNRLILVGNGFDLAHGMRTSYNDFILWYVACCFEEARSKHIYEDELLRIKASDLFTTFHELAGKSVKEYIYAHYCNDTLSILMNCENDEISHSFIFASDLDPWERESAPTMKPFEIVVKSALLKQLISNCSSNRWVDIENLFYEMLKKAIFSTNQQKQEDIKRLNQSLSFLIQKLESYFSSLDCSAYIPDYSVLLTDEIIPTDMVDAGSFRDPFRSESPDNTLILNFNYTSTIEKYVSVKNVNVNYIHGKLNDKQNPIIFGFGDELDGEYNKFELDTTKEIFRYIKSFWYFKTSNYHNLLRFIQSNKFQVYILGHSCGLSDRTMLNMIFEHENCISIKIHYYALKGGSNNYTELTEEISRHFKDKRQMRLKIVPLDKSTAMPQFFD